MNAQRWGKAGRSKYFLILLFLTAFLAICLLVLKQVAEHKVRDNQELISAKLQEAVSFPIQFDSLEPVWSGLSFGIVLKNVVLIDSGEPIPFVSIEKMQVFPNLLDLVQGREINFSKVVLSTLKLHLQWASEQGISIVGLKGERLSDGFQYQDFSDFLRLQNKILVKKGEIHWSIPEESVLQEFNAQFGWINKDQDQWFVSGHQHLTLSDNVSLPKSEFEFTAKLNENYFSVKSDFGHASTVCEITKQNLWGFNCNTQGKNVNLSLFRKAYTPKESDPKFLKWLSHALPSGVLTSIDIKTHGDEEIWHASGDITFRSVDFHYLDKWPSIKDSAGRVEFNSDKVLVHLQAGKIMGESVDEVTAIIEPIAKTQRPTVRFEGSMHGTLQAGYDFLKDSPLNARFIPYLSPLNITGPMQLSLKMSIPLEEGAPVDLEGLMATDNAELTIPKINLRAKQVSGNVSFSEKAITSHDLVASIQGHPITGSLQTSHEDKSTLRLETTGIFEVDWFKKQLPTFPWEFVKGEVPLKLTLDTPLQGDYQDKGKWEVASTLKGTSIELPAPFGKSIDTNAPISIVFHSNESEQAIYKIHWQDRCRAELTISKRDGGLFTLSEGTVHIGKNDILPLRKPKTLVVEGNLDNFSLTDWEPLFRASSNQSWLPKHYDVSMKVAQVRALGLDLEDFWFHTDSPKHWEIRSPIIEGDVMLASKTNKTLQIKLGYLKLSDRNTQFSENMLKQQHYPIHFSCEDLQYQGRSLGEVVVDLMDKPYGYEISRLTIGSDMFELTGKGAWHIGDKSKSVLQGDVVGTNMGEMLKQFGYPSAIRESSGHFQYDFVWPGDPLDFSIQKVSGNAELRFDKGRILGIEPGLGRIMGLLNIESIKRRLQLDFSDVLEQGFVFDILQGNLKFNQGIASTEQMVIDGPSAKIELRGDTNLVEKTVNLDMLVTPHMGAGLPIAAAIAAGNPAVGAGVWLFDKITGSKITKITEHHYHVSGTWSAPVIEDKNTRVEK